MTLIPPKAETNNWPVLKRGKFENAIDLFSKVIDESPDFAEGWNKRATLHFLMGNFNESIQDINKTLALEPRHFGALDGLGQIQFKLNNFYSENDKLFVRYLKHQIDKWLSIFIFK